MKEKRPAEKKNHAKETEKKNNVRKESNGATTTVSDGDFIHVICS